MFAKLSAQDFVAKWRKFELAERSAAPDFVKLRPTWLNNAHLRLDEAVFATYAWPADLSDDKILARLLALNLERAAWHGEDKIDARSPT